MSLDGLVTFSAPAGPRIACTHEGDGKHCTNCGASINPDANTLGPRACKKRHEALCNAGSDHCPHCGEDISFYRLFQIA